MSDIKEHVLRAQATRRANQAKAEALATKDDTTCPGCGTRIATPPLMDLGERRWTAPSRWCRRCGGTAPRKETP